VSVAIFAYNHERYIAQALESVLAQRVPFAFEIVIGEDSSPDGTRAIVERIAARRPDIVRPIFHPRNVGAHANSLAVLSACRGEFVAFLDGDDYWLAPDKLARQVAVLDRDPRIAFTWHSLQLVDGDGQLLNRLPWNKHAEGSETTEQILVTGLPGTAGVLIRRSVLDLEALAEFKHCPQGDYPMWLLALRGGRLAHFDPACLAAYRRHSGGATATFARPDVQVSLAAMWQLIGLRTGLADHPECRKQVWRAYYDASRGFADQGRWWDSMRTLAASARYAAMPLGTGIRDYGKCALRNCVRSLTARPPSPSRT
jgi:glycosyltransferase involved in cell wall biosynthesis